MTDEPIPKADKALLPQEKLMLDFWNIAPGGNLSASHTFDELMEFFRAAAIVQGSAVNPNRQKFGKILKQLVRKGFVDGKDNKFSLTPAGIAVAEALRDDADDSKGAYERKPN